MMLSGPILFMIGFMGSGKTTAGKKLASLLGWTFIDLDRKIVEQAGKTIPEIFSQHGEAWFRQAESDILKNLGSEPGVVISTGGGAPCYKDNMSYMLETGLTIYLKLTPEQLLSRLSNAREERPLLKGMKGEELLGFITDKLEERERWYSQAEIIVDGFDLDINNLYSRVKATLKQ
jgi:shikimate kinase